MEFKRCAGSSSLCCYFLVFCWVVRALTVSWGGRRMECRTASPRWIQESQRCRCPLTIPLRFWTRPCLDSHHGPSPCCDDRTVLKVPAPLPHIYPTLYVLNFLVSFIDELTGCFPQVEELVGPRHPHTGNDLLLLLHRLPGSNSADGNCKYKPFYIKRVALVVLCERLLWKLSCVAAFLRFSFTSMEVLLWEPPG